MKKIIAIIAAVTLWMTPATAEAYTKPATFSQTAINAGWRTSQLRTLACIITRESGWNPRAHNPSDPGYGSFGWTQLNMTPGKYGTLAYYGRHFGYNLRNLFVPATNLRVAKVMFDRSGRIWGDPWRPWRPLGRCA